MPKLVRADGPQYSAMKAIIIYKDFASAAKANAALQNASHYPDVHVQWNIRPWRVDMLKFPPTATEALADATDAHLIVFAGDFARLFSHSLQDWLEQWARHRQIETAALALIGTGNAGNRPISAVGDLSQFVKRHGLNIIFDDCGVIGNAPPFPIEVLLDSTGSKPSITPQIRDQQKFDENRE